MAEKKKPPKKRKAKRKPAARPASVASYARHRRDRGLPGGTHRAVQKAIEDERLRESVVWIDVRGKRTPKIRSFEQADKEWSDNTTRGASAEMLPEGEDVPDPDVSLKEAQRRKEIELWRQVRVKRKHDELELAVRKGELIPIDEARATVIEEYSVVKTKLLGLPNRVRQRIPTLTAADVAMISDLVREALESLADGE